MANAFSTLHSSQDCRAVETANCVERHQRDEHRTVSVGGLNPY
jgi:hypothetical protein